LLAPWAIRLVYGSSFVSAVTPARLLLLSILPLALYLPSAAALTAAGRERTWMKIQACGLLVDVVLVAILGSRHGANGAALAWLLSELSVFGIVTLVLARWRPGAAREPVVPYPA
jgi:O-antigen/teichoic acid export membrane protein